MTGRLRTWREATHHALYGAEGFFRRNRPGAHFRTSVHASALFAQAVLVLARSAGVGAVIDVGAGGGELVRALRRLDPGLHLTGVELAERPADLPDDIAWADTLPKQAAALLVANEWLDNVPVDVVELTDDGWRVVLVDGVTGAEQLGPLPDADDLTWLDRWWPRGGIGDRAEVGRPRDEAWAGAVGAIGRGVAVAIDYAHTSADRPAAGSLTGYRDGRQVPPAPDGSTDITSHVALDACAAAGEQAGATSTLLTSQQQALQALGVRRNRPDLALARTDPPAYLRALGEAGEMAELTDAAGLGGFGWLVQGVGVAVPQLLLTGTDR